MVDLDVSTDGDFLAFVPNTLTAPTGAHVRLTFHHAGKYVTQQHNWVLVLPGKAEAIDKAAAKAGEAAGWLPKGDPRIIAATPLCGRGGTVMVEFTAPAPGRYPFLCTFPGHGEEMHGVLQVTA